MPFKHCSRYPSQTAEFDLHLKIPEVSNTRWEHGWSSQDENGKGIIYSSFGPLGSMAWYDMKKNYAGVVMLGDAQNNQQSILFNKIRSAIDGSIE